MVPLSTFSVPPDLSLIYASLRSLTYPEAQAKISNHYIWPNQQQR